MNVLIVNTSDITGGAAIAANRLMEALCNNGVKATMLVRDKNSDNLRVVSIEPGLKEKWNFLWERWCIYMNLHLKKDHLFELDIANAGSDITAVPEFKEADIIHLHWINQGMLSVGNIKKIIDSGKPVVWTMHDFWPATGICHYPHECKRYESRCSHCPYLPGGGGDNDLAARVWKKKKKIYDNANLTFVTCSRWLGEQAGKSALLAGKEVVAIPNPIDTHIFHPADKSAARRALGLPDHKKLILFVSQRATDKRKGMQYFVEACQKLVAEHRDTAGDAAVVILGSHADELARQLPISAYPLGYVSDRKKIIDAYNAVDAYVLPSLEDNLPNTIMEAMACGVPCVGFKTGGIPEMIDHLETGYVARYSDAHDLAEGIHRVLQADDNARMGANAVAKVAAAYSQNEIARCYKALYARLLDAEKR